MYRARILKNYEWDGYTILRQTPDSSGIWGNVQFTEEAVDECDHLVVINYPPHDLVVRCNPENIWLMIQEPYRPDFFPWMTSWDSQYSRIFIPTEEMADGRFHATQTCLPWFDYDKVMTYDQLKSMGIPEKVKAISIMATMKSSFSGHLRRIEFVRHLQQEMSGEIDFYGRGINPIENKWDALAPYKYSIAIENTSSPHYWTEKLADCFLAYTLPIYYGCTNLDRYFPSDSFVQIDIENPVESVEIIRRLLQEDSWGRRLAALQEARELVLEKYQLFPFLAGKICESTGDVKDKKAVYLRGYEKGSQKTAAPELLFSVVVCTYNRADLLPECLDSLARQTFNQGQFEVVIVNNNSTDETQEVVDRYVQGNAGFRSVFEQAQGLSNARNTGIREARGEFLAFIDDDARAPENWLEMAARIIAAHSPDVFGGPVYPSYGEAPPAWFKDSYAVRGRMAQTGWMTRGHIAGTNIFFRKELLEKYGGFDPALGMKGDEVGYHEETALVHRAISEGKKVYYDDELTVTDRLPDYKLSLSYSIFSNYKIGFDGADLLNRAQQAKELGLLADKIDSTMSKFDFALRKRDISRHKFPENYILEEVAKEFIDIGILVKQGMAVQSTSCDNATEDNLADDTTKLVGKYGMFRLMGQLLRHVLSAGKR